MLFTTAYLLFLDLAAKAIATPILGLSLAPKYLTIAQSLANGSTAVLVQFEGNSAYSTWFEETARSPEFDEEEAYEPALKEALGAVQSAVNRILRQPAQISIVTCPQSHRELALKVVSQLNLLMSFDPYVIQYQTPYSALHYAYQLGKCEIVGLPEDCDPEDIFGAALWVDFNAASLRISLLDFSEYGCIRHATSDAIFLDDVAFPKDEIEQPAKFLETAFEDFLDGYTVVTEFQVRSHHEFVPLRSKIAAIVVSGDPLLQYLEMFRDAVDHVSPELTGRIRDLIPPSEAMAIGAATRGRLIWEHPEWFAFHEQNIVAIPHEEL
ncbi:hypothetical protein D6C85_06492 [Aureobasidium pullulans]|uniref:Uncharacterized protein n=1 Tax=Aureobasidium pullulans TaxID=5580 RepID=A0A4S9WUK2_AURPU|nr:hypothetical protein D6C85_06492 [Aureobasidium pullulans]